MASEGRKVISKLAKATGAEPCCGLRIEKLNEAHFGVKMCKTPFSEHLWKLRCWKSARRRGGSTCRSQNGKSTHHVRSTFGRSNVIFRDYNCSCDYNYTSLQLHYTTPHLQLHNTTPHHILPTATTATTTTATTTTTPHNYNHNCNHNYNYNYYNYNDNYIYTRDRQIDR